MRLLDTKTRKLHEFSGRKVPSYAILSHTWDEDEVTFGDLQRKFPWYKRKHGYAKIKNCCRRALQDGLRYVWIDTCCIDKSSSAELSEAINSMYQWYQGAAICYSFLADVPPGDVPDNPESWFRRSRWFRRGWTLQELIAPRMVLFFNSAWAVIGSRSSSNTTDVAIKESAHFVDLGPTIEAITGIGWDYLIGDPGSRRPMRKAAIAERMSWASNRETTRTEDMAYSLMGLFDVNMPLLYGEGRKAFVRLQDEIMKASGDHTILAWGLDMPYGHFSIGGCLASSPQMFTTAGRIAPSESTVLVPFAQTNVGLRIELPVCVDEKSEAAIAILDCEHRGSPLAVPLRAVRKYDGFLSAERYCPVVRVADDIIRRAARRTIYIQSNPTRSDLFLYIDASALIKAGWHLSEAWPPYAALETRSYDSQMVRNAVGFDTLPYLLISFSQKDGQRFVVRLRLLKESTPRYRIAPKYAADFSTLPDLHTTRKLGTTPAVESSLMQLSLRDGFGDSQDWKYSLEVHRATIGITSLDALSTSPSSSLASFIVLEA
ncbi:hypothetical protein JX266_012440 [Neoarthrinium moseri]|nr:hypothetical protein JX266_012440 [Neoarthrinium moseri]